MEKLVRDSYGKVNYINIPFHNTGSVSDICIKIEDKELNQALQDLSDSIDKSYKNSDVYEFITNKYRKK
ncbi:CJH_07325 family protein [Campylobacter jejuni]|uniref:CJH_07325 family protein n=1 Tax=Campylobacter jejuni TaxID=197 RepID=A0A6F9L8D1_CAMJU|nr:CJH_07325 family protein [Campylobacter jejuni]EAK5169780.1 CJH_07325 family protein [Campylobacter jejuni]EAK8637658.1 CJH_07325 family protein [Campylobacter jejuni]EAL2247863.1 CJH_07325 family protein [Campylobacter jejuni]EAL9212350.1 CJH_07325 family protein [Campylobacter jejuni]